MIAKNKLNNWIDNMVMYNKKQQIKNWLDEHKIYNYVINTDLTVDVNDSVRLKKIKDKQLPVQFNKVSGDFIYKESGAISLKGCPKIVGGNFNCSGNQLTTLEYCPEEVKGDFSFNNNQIKDLKYFPKIVGGSIHANTNQLTTLNGFPELIDGNLYVEKNQIKTLKSAVKKITGSFNARKNLLENLEGLPEIGSSILVPYNKINSLKGSPVFVNGDFDIYCNELTILEFSPKKIEGDFSCFKNKLTSLKYSPTEILNDFLCFYNEIKDLKDAPEKVGGKFECGGKHLENLQGDLRQSKAFICRESPKVKSIKGLKLKTDYMNLAGTGLDDLDNDVVFCPMIKFKYIDIQDKYNITVNDNNKIPNQTLEEEGCILMTHSEMQSYALRKKLDDAIPKQENKKTIFKI